MARTKIEWTATYHPDGSVTPGYTFNPWWGCVKVSPGCAHCYAETFSKRTGHGVWGKDAPRRFFGDKYWGQLSRWNAEAAKVGQRARVFVASMADVFEANPLVEQARERLFRAIDETPSLDYLLLTKRPENILNMIPEHWRQSPPANVWYGASVENQRMAEDRLPALMAVPATVRFLSCEPLLGALHLRPWLATGLIHWGIIGGESGPGARPMIAGNAYELVRQFQNAGVPIFVKQMGSVLARDWKLQDAKGGDIDEWPEWARIREFPAVKAEVK